MNLQQQSILGEGNTPLTLSKHIAKNAGVRELWLKNEGLNPSGSFKDRESAIVFLQLVVQGVSGASIASCGNAAISACLYGKHFGIGVHCVVSDKVPEKKRQLIESLGGDLTIVPGYYIESYDWLVENPLPGMINITSGQYHDRELGDRVIAEEIYAEGVSPDTIIVPVGNGSLLHGIFKGLQELKAKGILHHYPRLIGVEVLHFAPVAEAIRQGKDWVAIQERPHSIADAGMAAQKAYCSKECIAALKATKGEMVEIEEESILPAVEELLAEGISVEPSSACVIAGLKKLKEQGVDTGITVAILTGSGQKDDLASRWSHLSGSNR